MNRTERQREGAFALCASAGTRSPPALTHPCSCCSDLWTLPEAHLWSPFWGLWTQTYIIGSPQASVLRVIPLTSLALHSLAEGGLWDSFPSIIMSANSYNKPPLIYICIIYIYTCIHIHIILILFSWRNLASAEFGTGNGYRGTEF